MKRAVYIALFLVAFVKGFSQKDSVYTVVDVAPEFPGGQMEMYKFLSENMVYPMKAKENDIQGKVFVKFIIDSKGKITNPVILKSAGSDLLDNEALRVVRLMPDWVPGKQGGQAVSAYYNLPINFKLTKHK